MRIQALSIGGRVQHHEVGRTVVPIAAWHNPASMCWLWSLDLSSVCADERRAFRAFAYGSFQRRYILQFWSWEFALTWQAEGRYQSPTHERQSRLAALFGLRF